MEFFSKKGKNFELKLTNVMKNHCSAGNCRLEHGPEICSPLESFEREMKPFLAPLERSNTH